MSATLKAYEVRESGEGNCCITFATNGATARREGANELNTDWECVESCKRAPWADQYAPGPVPVAASLAAGWWHECGHCGVQFDEDGRRGEEEGERDDECEPVDDGHRIFCSPTCRMEDWAEWRARKTRENATVEACATIWPGATSITAHDECVGRGPETKATATFRFTGGKYSARWAVGDGHASVFQDDVDAFKAWKADQR